VTFWASWEEAETAARQSEPSVEEALAKDPLAAHELALHRLTGRPTPFASLN
jgi:hypothetical protein